MKQVIIFTDLDGTLLDATTYSFDAAREALALIKERNVPLVFCSSKTRREIEHYRQLMSNEHPFISENGGGIFISRSDPFLTGLPGENFEADGNYSLIRLGKPYEYLRNNLRQLRKKGFNARGFGDMTVQEVSLVTGLPEEEAEKAKERDFDEPFLFNGTNHEVHMLVTAISELGLGCTRGRFFHLMGANDKGKAVSLLTELYRKRFGKITTIAIGDSPNDLPMLQYVDFPVIVKKIDGSYDPELKLPQIMLADGIGPVGWNNALVSIIASAR